MPFDIDKFKSLLKTKTLGQNLHYFAICDSTNEEARRLSLKNRESGTLILADEQTAGRGRWGRRWEGLSGQSLLMTLVLPEGDEKVTPARMGVAIGVGLSRSCETLGVFSKLKWPNDLLVGDKKLSGMLMESHDGILVAGIGLNVSQSPKDFPVELKDLATSLSMETGEVLAREAVLATFLLGIENALNELTVGGFDAIKQDWHRRALYLGDIVSISTTQDSGEVLEGTLMGLDYDGALLLRREQGLVLPVVAGDLVKLRPVLT